MAQNHRNFLEKYRTNKENKKPKHLRTYENNPNSNQNIYIMQNTISNEKDKINKNKQILKTNDNIHEIEPKNELTTPNIYHLSTESQNNNNNYMDLINGK